MVVHVRATYRVQLTPTFGLDHAAAMVPYLARLGISHLYTSPLAEATPGSTHGYDVADPGRVRAELGGEPALRRLWTALGAAGMGHVVDLVPNHMGIRDPSNRWWQDVLRHGPDSAFADHFDIDWDPPDPESEGRVVLPFLGAPAEQVLQDGTLRVERGTDPLDLTVCHHGDRWPASEQSLAVIDLGPGDCTERVDGVLDGLNRSPEALAEFLAAQHWRAVHWRDAPRLLNWRRFFDVTDLAALRVDRAPVFDDVHALLRGWMADDLGGRVVQGVRIDHVDGLVDPEEYLVRLRGLVGPERLVVVEKILAATERLPVSWPADGTTGYDALARLDEALTDPARAGELRRQVGAVTGLDDDWPALERRCRQLVAGQLLVPEVARAARALAEALPAEAVTTTHGTEAAVTALAVELRVYRTYARPGATAVADADRHELRRAATTLGARHPDVDPGLVEATRALLAHEGGGGPGRDALVARFAQLTAPLAAKAVEDTAFYRDATLPWLTEVGGDPGRTSVPLDEVHAALTALSFDQPGTFVPLTTHDTKRSGDVRARLSRLAVDPERTVEAFADWRRIADRHRSPAGPGPAMDWLLWTSLVGAWPIDADRMADFATKAGREAKDHTSWTDPDQAYEDAVERFVRGALADPVAAASIDAFAGDLLADGRATSLALVTLACTAAGSPDVYRGDEAWNLALVDPDNRRPVDPARLAALLDRAADPDLDLAALWAGTAADPADDGLVKVAVWHRLLRLRARHPLAFAAPHHALPVDGPDRAGVLAFTRGDHVAVVAAVRAVPVGGAVVLPSGPWQDVFTGARHQGGPTALGELLAGLPMTALVRG